MKSSSSLSDQRDQRGEFILDYVPDDVKVSIIAYSISCHFVLDLLKIEKLTTRATAVTSDSKPKKIDNIYFIFPAIERMKHTPYGKFLLPSLKYFTWLGRILVLFSHAIPRAILFKILKTGFTSEGKAPPDEFITGILDMTHPVMLKEVMNLLEEAFEDVNQLDIETIEKNKERIMFYYGATDGLCPKKYFYELKEKVPGVQAHLCQEGIHHTFMKHTSAKMAHLLKNMMDEQEKKATQTTQPIK